MARVARMVSPGMPHHITQRVNQRECWRGYLWQGRRGAFVVDAEYSLTAMCYVELNPVRARLAYAPADWPWSSARVHLSGECDPLMGNVHEMIDYVGDWQRYLALDVEEAERLRIRKHSRTGRPLGSEGFIKRLEQKLGRIVGKRKPGPKGPRDGN